MCDFLSNVIHDLQQQSLKKAAEVAAGEVIQDAQDYVAAESAALRSKEAKGMSMDVLRAQGELCTTVVYSLTLCTVLLTAKLDTNAVLLVCVESSVVSFWCSTNEHRQHNFVKQ